MNKKYRLIFFGTPDFSVPTLAALIADARFEVIAVVTQPDRPSGRGNKLQPSPIKIKAQEHQIKILQPENIRKQLPQFLSELELLSPIDIAVVIAFGQILPLAVLNFPTFGSVNLHASLLPRWRGAAPIQRSIEAGDQETGICLMQMEAGLDTGPVFSERKLAITSEDQTGTLHDKLAKLAAQITIEDLPLVLQKAIIPQAQNNSLATYARKIERVEEKIDWSQSADQINNKIRAFAPYPGAYTSYQNKVFKILAADPQAASTSAAPGQVIYQDKTTLEIACGQGSLRIKMIKPEGKREMEIQQFLQGNQINIGDSLQ